KSFLHQRYSWSRLQVSETFLRQLFTLLKVHPDFLEIIFLFGEKIGPVEESFGSFFSHCRPQNVQNPFVEPACSYDIGYNIKYAALHMRSFPKDPFSIRETGVYHSFNANTQKSSWVFLQASDSLRERIKHCFSRTSESQAMVQFQIHGMVLQTASHGWRDYLVYLEETFSKLVDRGFYTNINGPQLEGDFEVDFSDIRKLQILTDKIRRLLQILQLNITLAEQMKCSMQRIRKYSPPNLSVAFDNVESSIEMSILQHRTYNSRLQSLVDRAQGISGLIQSILEIRTSESSKKINNRMHELAEKGTTQDTRSMSVISFISAIFLPATFLAVRPTPSISLYLADIPAQTLFGMNFFDFRGDGLTIATNFWIYIVMAGALSGMTVLLWFYWQRSVKAKYMSEKDDIESNKGRS
ncbi:hypothetical protein ASPWEDRAFT_105628, partial [Aspergillus wentii DTO 134E9]